MQCAIFHDVPNDSFMPGFVCVFKKYIIVRDVQSATVCQMISLCRVFILCVLKKYIIVRNVQSSIVCQIIVFNFLSSRECQNACFHCWVCLTNIFKKNLFTIFTIHHVLPNYCEFVLFLNFVLQYM